MKITITSQPCSTIKNKTGGWRTYRPKINFDKCTSCGTCSRTCPEGIVAMVASKEGKLKPQIDLDFCKGCGLCAEECPAKAIEMEIDK